MPGVKGMLRMVPGYPEDMPNGVKRALYSKANYRAKVMMKDKHPAEFNRLMEEYLPFSEVEGTTSKYRADQRLKVLEFLSKTYPTEFRTQKLDLLQGFIREWGKRVVEATVGESVPAFVNGPVTPYCDPIVKEIPAEMKPRKGFFARLLSVVGI